MFLMMHKITVFVYRRRKRTAASDDSPTKVDSRKSFSCKGDPIHNCGLGVMLRLSVSDNFQNSQKRANHSTDHGSIETDVLEISSNFFLN